MQTPILPPSPAAGGVAAKERMSVAEAARELETTFLVELLKVARQAGEPLAEKSETAGAESYQEFAERRLAEELASHDALGLAQLLERELLRPEVSPADKQVGSTEP